MKIKNNKKDLKKTKLQIHHSLKLIPKNVKLYEKIVSNYNNIVY